MSARILAQLLLACAFAVPLVVRAAPPAALTMIVGEAPDEAADALVRSLRKTLHAPVRVESVVGANGAIAAARVARSRGDGSMLLLADNGLAIAARQNRRVPLDPLRDFTPIGLVSEASLVLAARADLGLPAGEALAAFMRAQSPSLSIAAVGGGSPSRLCAQLLTNRADALATAHYKSLPPALADLVSGQVDFICELAPRMEPYLRRGQLRTIGRTAAQRESALASGPALADLGFEHFDLSYWQMLLGPAGMPEHEVDTLVQALHTFAVDHDGHLPAVRVARSTSPAAAREVLRREIAKWSAVIDKGGLAAD